MASIRDVWLVLAVVATQCLWACDEGPAPAPAARDWVAVCIDADGDGYGFQCAAGSDCDDEDETRQTGCGRCDKASQGCSCDPGSMPLDCTLPYELTAAGDLLCRSGTRYCREGTWSGCEGIRSFALPAGGSALQSALIAPDAAVVSCSPCSPDCYRVTDDLASTDAGLAPGVVSVPSGGVTLAFEEQERVPPDAGLLDETPCTPGVAPDVDCDGIPDTFDAYPGAPPFESDHRTIFMDLAPGERGQQDFAIQFRLNTADIYFYLDMTASMEGERDNLIASLTSGNYLPNRGLGIECADRDFDGAPDDQLKNGGIAGNIACLIRDAQVGAGWFRDIPFEGPYRNGIRVASSDFELFEHRQDITSNVGAVQSALSTFTTRGNNNVPEGSMQGLWSLVTGGPIYTGWTRPGIPARTGCPAGTWGYPCFREEAVPIVVHIGDAPLQNGPSPTSAARAGFLSDCQEECSCVRESCRYGFCYCVEQSCSCENESRHPLDYDDNVVAGMQAGTESDYRSFDTSAETLARAQDVGVIDDLLVTYAGSTAKMTSDLRYASLGSCPSGSSGWSSSSESAPDAVLRFRVASTKTLTLSTRGSRFDTALLVKRIGSSSVLGCNNDLSSSDADSEITRSFSPGDYYVVLKGRRAGEAGEFQLTLGDKQRQVTRPFQPKRWLGPNGDGVTGIRAALQERAVRVISINSSTDPYLREQADSLALATGAVDGRGAPLTFGIQSNGTGMGSAVIDAVNLLAGNLAMDVSVVLREQPDTPAPHFQYRVHALDTPGDLCDPPIDTDNDAEHLPDTHVRCRPGAAPRFQVSFTNPPSPHHVPPNSSDPEGGYNMRLELIGDGAYVVDRIPVYIIPEDVVPSPPELRYASSASYEQTLGSPGCMGNEAPLWTTLHFNADLPEGTALRFEACAGATLAELAGCTPRLLAEVFARGACRDDADCPDGACSDRQLCTYVSGPSCTSDRACPEGSSCKAGRCAGLSSPVDIRNALSLQQGRALLRTRSTLAASTDAARAPTLYDWQVEYSCAAQE